MARPGLYRAVTLAVALFLALPALVPARQATPDPVPVMGSPAAGAEVEILLDMTVPEEMMPDGPVMVYLGLYTWEAGATVSVDTGVLAAGAEVDLILEGAWVTRCGATQLLSRAGTGGPLEEIPADTDVGLGAGDGIALVADAYYEIRNPDTGPGKAMFAVVSSTAAPAVTGELVETGFDFEFLAEADPTAWGGVAPGAVRYVFWEAVLDPGASISAPPAVQVQLVAAESGPGRARLKVAADGSTRNEGQGDQPVVGVTLIPVAAEDATT